MRSLLLFALLLTPAIAQEPQHKAAEHQSEGAKHAEESHGPPLGLMWANFLILAGGLGYMIGKNAGPFFQSRTNDIQSGLKEAKKLRTESEARVAEIERRVSNVQTEIQTMRDGAKTEMNAEAERIRKETSRQIAKVQAAAQNEINFSAKLAQQELRAHSAEVAIQLAAGIVRERLHPAMQEDLAESFVRQLATAQKVTH